MSNTVAELLPREQVATVLAGALGRPLVLLTAPSGYGKTTAARKLMADLPFPSYYLSVPQGAESPRWLWDHFCSRIMAQREQRGEVATLAPLLQKAGFPGDNASIRRVLEHIREDTAGRRVLIIIDDWHFAAFPDFDVFLERLIYEGIPNLTLLLISRTQPAFALEDLRLKGLAQVFRQDLLAFSEEEAVDYFARHGIHDAKVAKTAWKFCEGWPAALWLALKANQQHPESALGLLERVVFPQYNLKEQRLLMQCSLLDAFSAEQAALTADTSAAPEILRRLLENNAFLTRESTSGLYSFHSLFRAFLSEKLAAAEDIDKVALYRRAGECSLLVGDLLRAALFFHRAGRDEDLLRLLDVFTMPRSDLLLFLSADQIVPLVLSIPWRLRAERPVAYLAFIYLYLAECDPLAAFPLLEEAETRFAQDPSIPAPLMQHLKGELFVIRSTLAFNDLWAMCDAHKAAHELLGGRSAIFSRHMNWYFDCPHVSSLYLRAPGSYGDLTALIEDRLHYFQDLSDGCGLGVQLLVRAEYLLECGEFTEVESILQAAVLRGESKEQVSIVLIAAFALARLYAATGRAEEGPALLRAWLPKVRALRHVDLVTCLDLALGYLAAVLGRFEDIPKWLREGEFNAPRSVPQMDGFIHAVHGKALVLLGDPVRLHAVARALPGPLDSLFVRIHGKILEALALLHIQGPEKALVALEAALELARPDGIVLTIAEYGAHILPLLRTLHKRNAKDPWFGRLVDLAARYPFGGNGSSTPLKRTACLTPREEEIMLYVVKGESNRAIAARLGIAPVTVNKQLSSAYTRLGAKNRAEAVRRFVENAAQEPLA